MHPDSIMRPHLKKGFSKEFSANISPLPIVLQYIADTVGCMGWVVMGSRPCVFIRDSYEKGKRHVRDIKAYQVS